MPRVAKVISQCMIDGKRIDAGAVVAVPDEDSYDRLTKAGCLVPASRDDVYEQEEKDNEKNEKATPKATVKKSKSKSEKQEIEITEPEPTKIEQESNSEVVDSKEEKDTFLDKNVLPKKKKARKKRKTIIDD